MSKLLGFFEQIAHFSLSLSKSEQFAKKNSKKIVFWFVFTVFGSFFKKAKDSLIPSKQRERITHVAQKEGAIVSKLLRSLTKNERMSKSLTF